MTDERIKQLAFRCFWACETNGTISTSFPRVVTGPIIEEAIRTALKEAAAPEAQAQNDLRRSFELIKEMVCGEASPRWTDAWSTTQTRGQIADICDVMIRRLAMNCGGEKSG